jgi:RNA polymerase sigma factor (sigma-70 family)
MTPPSRRGALDPELDARLVARCLEGDSRAWAELVARHERLVYSVGRAWRLSDEDLGDVFQEVFAALVRGLPRLRDGRSLVRWLSSTTDRVARTRALRRRREQALQASDEDAVERVPDTGEAVGAELEELESQAAVRLALSRLPERCQRLIRALYYEDPVPAYADLARRLGVPVGSLGPTRARCMEKLRAELAGASDAGGSISGGTPPTSGTTRERPPGSRSAFAHVSPTPPPAETHP